jgi:hypothetical protein
MYFKSSARTSMHRRKVQGELGDRTDQCDVKVVVNTQATGFQQPWRMEARLEFKNSEGQEQLVKLPHELLMNLKNAIDQLCAAVPMAEVETTVIGDVP